MTKEELCKIIASDESFRIERTTSKGAMDKFQVAICVFANDMPNSGKKSYLLIGIYDNGQISGMKVGDALMKRMSGIHLDSNNLPMSIMITEKAHTSKALASLTIRIIRPLSTTILDTSWTSFCLSST